MTTDKRRFGVVEVRRRNAETYHLMIDGQMWSEVEWSHNRQAWCVQDAAGRCLAHVECRRPGPRRRDSDTPRQAHDRRRPHADVHPSRERARFFWPCRTVGKSLLAVI